MKLLLIFTLALSASSIYAGDVVIKITRGPFYCAYEAASIYEGNTPVELAVDAKKHLFSASVTIFLKHAERDICPDYDFIEIKVNDTFGASRDFNQAKSLVRQLKQNTKTEIVIAGQETRDGPLKVSTRVTYGFPSGKPISREQISKVDRVIFDLENAEIDAK